MNSSLQIREITKCDAEKIIELIKQLGYKIDLEIAVKQIKTVLSDNKHFAFVTEIDNILVGYIHGFLAIRLTTETFLEIGALVVDENYKAKGIGSKLVQYLESEIPNNITVRVRCNLTREIAHQFYSSLGYKEKKQQKIFEKST